MKPSSVGNAILYITYSTGEELSSEIRHITYSQALKAASDLMRCYDVEYVDVDFLPSTSRQYKRMETETAP